MLCVCRGEEGVRREEGSKKGRKEEGKRKRHRRRGKEKKECEVEIKRENK